MKKTKKEEYEEPAVAPEDEDMEPETRLDILEDEVKSIGKAVKAILKAVKKEDYEREPGRQPQEEGDIEEEHKKKKDGIATEDVNPNPKGGDAKLPDAPAGETDEEGEVEGDKATDPVSKREMLKMINQETEKRVNEIMKNMGIKKSTTPRAKHEQDIAKDHNKNKNEFAYDLLKRAKEGKLTAADMNRETKEFVKKNYDDNIKRVIDFEMEGN